MSLASPRLMSPIGMRPRLPLLVVLLIWASAIGIIAAFFFYFSGHWRPFGTHQQAPPAAVVQAPAPTTPLVRPPETKTIYAQTGAAAPGKPPSQVVDVERQKALASGIRGFANGRGVPSGGSHTDGAAGKDQPPGELDPLEASLKASRLEGTEVTELPNPRWTIRHGRILPCAQNTRENSTLPGMITATIPDVVYGETGDTKLLPAGAQVFGTVQHALVNGLDRLAVLWQDITTPVIHDAQGRPHQYRITTDSPATSEMGETGLDGDINRHLFNPFPGKLGAIIGMSLIQGGIQAGVSYLGRSQGNNSNNSNTALNFNSFQNGGQSATETLLRSYIEIPDVLTRDQGLVCGIGIIRDLNFHKAYRLLTEKGML